MGVTLDDEARQYLATFEDVTGVDGRDCIRQQRLEPSADAAADEIDDDNDDDDDSVGTDGGDGDGNDGDVADRRLIVVVSNGRMGEAIGPGGRTVRRFEDRVDSPVRLVEGADDPEVFVANALAPAAVYNVTISENEDTVAYVEVAQEDRGVAIGSNGRTIEAARRLAKRHFGIDDIQLI